MKRILFLVLAAIIAFSLVTCSESAGPGVKTDPEDTSGLNDPAGPGNDPKPDNTYTVTFDLMDGFSSFTQKVTKGTCANKNLNG